MHGVYEGLRGFGAWVIEAVLWVVDKIRLAAYAPVLGRYYEYRGNPIDIHEEDSGRRWISLRDLRRSLPALAPTSRLQALYPEQVLETGAPREMRVEARALEQHLLKAQDPAAIRFLRWMQRDVIFPAQKKARSARGG